MRSQLRRRVHILAILAMLASILVPAIAAFPASAQGEECPEGLVYVPSDDICMLEEDVPEGVEFIDQHADDGEQTTDDTTDDEQMEVDVTDATDDVSDDADLTDEEDLIDEGDQLDQGEAVDEFDDQGDGDVQDADAVDDTEDAVDAAEEVGEIRNITLVTYPCPVNWNPATREIADSHEMCTVPPVPAMSYTILYEGEMMVEVAVQTDADLDKDLRANGIPLKAGMWTIQEKQQEGLDDPFAFCAIYAADGNMRMLVQEFAPGGKMDFLLAEGEELNCEWFSVAEVPEITGDPNALPIGGLKLHGWNCPYGTDDFASEAYLLAACNMKGQGGVEYTASLDGVVVSTQIGPGDAPEVDFQTGLDSRLLSGTWTISATQPEGYDGSIIFCTITSEAGAVTALEPESLFGSVEMVLQPGDTGFCNWFNVESEPRSGTALGISLLLHTCPADFDLGAGDYQTCTLPLQEPISFDFIHNGQVVETGTAPAAATELKFTANGGKPEAGEWTIRPAVAGNRLEPGWACWGVDATGQKVLSIDYFTPLDGGSGISAKFGPNLMLQCDVWIYSNDLSQGVVVTAYVCPDDFDAANPVAGDRYAACTKNQRIPFIYTIDDGTAVQIETGRGGILLAPAQAGQWRIAFDPTANSVEHSVTFVTCDHTFAALNQVQTIEPTINSDKLSITLDLDEGDALACDFFLGPPLAPSDPTGADGGLDTAETDSEGEAATDDAAGSDVSVEVGTAEDTSDGEAEVMDDTSTAEDTGADSASAGSSTVTVQQWKCPEPVSPDTALADLMVICDASSADATLILTDSQESTGKIPTSGLVSWTGLDAGSIAIGLETAGITDPVVYCSSSTLVDGETVDVFPEQVAASGGTIELTLEADSEVYCDWFNSPAGNTSIPNPATGDVPFHRT
jgi:hypothetical protein